MSRLLAKPLTNRQYREHGGMRCPFCLEREIEGSSITIEADEAYQEVWCNYCHANWEDKYILVGYEVTEGPSEDEG